MFLTCDDEHLENSVYPLVLKVPRFVRRQSRISINALPPICFMCEHKSLTDLTDLSLCRLHENTVGASGHQTNSFLPLDCPHHIYPPAHVQFL